MVEKVRLSCLNGAAVDLSDMFLTVSNNIISRSALGRIYENEGCDESFGGLSRKAIDLIASFCFKDMFHFLGWMDTLTGLVAVIEAEMVLANLLYWFDWNIPHGGNPAED
ncbi:hypothetical protein POTOM_050598 [Populus tomentosa]|uniref:Uncharacterized protein n=1 Tax=Populus tomentosa TaxID=118781 RepID=A0A8X7Y9F6_POPTO|nr:hypothetical protein POTOM_050598 [Populus tomentosa]